MPRFQETRTIAASREGCWSLLTDASRVPDWLTIADRVRAEGQPGTGQRLHAHGAAMGVQLALELEVSTWEPGRRYGWHLTDPVVVAIAYDLTDDGPGRTRLDALVDADLGHRVSMRGRLAVRVLRGELGRSLDRFVDLAESSS